MVCPKCGFNGPDGMECSRCGVIVDKFARRTHGGAQGTPAEQLRRLPPQASKERPRRPIGRTIAWGLVLISAAVGIGVLLDYMRLHLHGNRILKVLRAAAAPRQYGNQLMTVEQVLQRVNMAAREENLELPNDRIYVKMKAESGDMGGFLVLTLKAHVHSKVAGVIKYPLYRSVVERIAMRSLKAGYAQFETNPQSDIAQDVAAMGDK